MSDMENSEYKGGTDFVGGIRISQVLVKPIWIRGMEEQIDDVWYKFSS